MINLNLPQLAKPLLLLFPIILAWLEKPQANGGTGLPAYSDSAGTLKKCHSNHNASYCVFVSKHFYYMKGQSEI